MKTTWLLLLALMCGGPIAAAATFCVQDDTKEKPAAQQSAEQEKDEAKADVVPTQEEADEDWSKLTEDEALGKVKEFDSQFTEQMTEFRKAYQAASTEDKAKMRNESPKPEQWIGKFQKLAELFPESNVAAQSLLWIVQHQRTGPAYEQALATMLEHHADLAELKPIIGMMQYQPPSQKTSESFGKLLATCQNRELLAVANYALLQYQKRTVDVQESFDKDSKKVEQFEQRYGKEQLEYVQNLKLPTEEERLASLEELAAEYGEVEISKGRTLAVAVEGEIFEAKNLQVGMVGPDIEGEDIDGTAFKLSDYRGKVVVLDFWGDW